MMKPQYALVRSSRKPKHSLVLVLVLLALGCQVGTSDTKAGLSTESTETLRKLQVTSRELMEHSLTAMTTTTTTTTLTTRHLQADDYEVGDDDEGAGTRHEDEGDDFDYEGGDGEDDGGDDEGGDDEGGDGGDGDGGGDGETGGDTGDGEGSDNDPSPASAPTPASDANEGGESVKGSEPTLAPVSAPAPSSGTAGESGVPPGDSPTEQGPEPTPQPTKRPTSRTPKPQNAPTPQYTPPEDDPLEEAGDDAAVQENWKDKDKSYVDIAKENADAIVHDRNVAIVSAVFGVLGFILLLITAQQMIENPDGCCGKVCRCCIGSWRVVCWPCRKVCGCTKKRRGTHAAIARGDDDGYGGYSHDLELT